MTNYVKNPEAASTNPARSTERELLVILLDLSASMGEAYDNQEQHSFPTPYNELRAAVAKFLSGEDENSLHSVQYMDSNGEVAIGVFLDEEARWLQLAGPSPAIGGPSEFGFVAYQEGLDLPSPSGSTPMGKAIAKAIEAVELRKKQLNDEARIHLHRPNIFLITDGKPTDDWEAVVPALRAGEKDKNFLFWLLSTRDAYAEILDQLAPESHYSLEGYSLSQIISFVSVSLSAQNRRSGQRTATEYYSQNKVMFKAQPRF